MAKLNSFDTFVDELIQKIWTWPRDLKNAKYLGLRRSLTNYLLIWIEGEVARIESGGTLADAADTRKRAQDYLRGLVTESGIELPLDPAARPAIQAATEKYMREHGIEDPPLKPARKKRPSRLGA